MEVPILFPMRSRKTIPRELSKLPLLMHLKDEDEDEDTFGCFVTWLYNRPALAMQLACRTHDYETQFRSMHIFLDLMGEKYSDKLWMGDLAIGLYAFGIDHKFLVFRSLTTCAKFPEEDVLVLEVMIGIINGQYVDSFVDISPRTRAMIRILTGRREWASNVRKQPLVLYFYRYLFCDHNRVPMSERTEKHITVERNTRSIGLDQQGDGRSMADLVAGHRSSLQDALENALYVVRHISIYIYTYDY